MKVLIVTTSFPRWRSDHRSPFIFEAARALSRQGVFVEVVAPHQPGALPQEDWDGVHIIRHKYLPQRWEVLQAEEGGLPVTWRSRPLARPAFAPFLLALTLAVARHGRGADIIHANWTLSGAAAWLSSFSHQAPVVVTVHGSDIYQAAQTPILRLGTLAVLRRADRIIAPSHDLWSATTAMGVAPQRVSVIPNGVDTDFFRPGADRVSGMVLAVGSLIERKGFAALIRAMEIVSRSDASAQLYLVGSGPQKDSLRQLVLDLNLPSIVHFMGSLPPATVAELMRRASVLVLPSLEEGQGVVVIEALASGTPCVVSAVGGIPEVVVPEVGVTVAPGDVSALAHAIASLLGDRALWQIRSKRARQRALDHYSWPGIALRLVAEYRTALSARA